MYVYICFIQVLSSHRLSHAFGSFVDSKSHYYHSIPLPAAGLLDKDHNGCQI